MAARGVAGPPARPTLSEVARLAADLVACDSTASELETASVLQRYLGGRRVDAQIRAVGEGRANLVARIPGAGTAPGLALSGHLDVVPANPAEWATEPFEPTVRDGRLHGRGTSDMKGAVAALAVAFADLASSGQRPAGDVVLACTAGEETDSSGARRMVADGDLDGIGWVVIGEPTRMDVGVGHKGLLWVSVETEGVAAHGAQPELGSNAITAMLRWLGGDEGIAEMVGAGEHPLLGSTTASLNVIRGGSATNVVADRCRAELDLRTLPGQTHGSLLVDLSMRAPAARLTVLRDAPAVMAHPGGALVSAAQAAVRAGAGRDPALRGLPYVTDGSVFSQQLGAETILLGPGDERLAHQADEHVELAALDAAVDVYVDLATRMAFA